MRLLLLLFLLGAVAAQDKPADEEVAPKADAAPAEGDAEEEEEEQQRFDWILTFQNGDTVHCDLQALAGRRLTVRWSIAPKTPVELELSAIAEVQRGTEFEKDNRVGTDTLRLRDGSVLYGRVTQFAAKQVSFEVSTLGVVKISSDQILDLVRHEVDRAGAVPRDKDHVVVTKAGQIIAGTMVQNEDGKVLVTGEGISATIDYEQVAVLLFPRPEPTEEESPAEKKAQPGVQVKLRDGSALAGKNPSLKDGVLTFKLASGQPIELKLADLQGVGFMDFGEFAGRTGMRSLLVWSKYADPTDELRKTMAIVEGGLKRWRITDDKSEAFDRAFRRKLFQTRTLLIPEMEKWRVANPALLGRSFRPMAEAYLRSGGNIVVCGVQNQHLAFLKEAGLIELTVRGSADNQNIEFTTAGRGLGKGVGGGWRAMNATFSYNAAGKWKTTTLAQHAGRAIAIGRRVGRGWIIVLGMDFYATNAGASKVLINAIKLR